MASALVLRPVRRLSVDELHRMIAAGIVREDEKVELIHGVLREMMPQGTAHAVGVTKTSEALRKALGPGVGIRVQLPLTIAPDSEPEPDVAIVADPDPDTYGEAHPTTALLVVEVADTSAATDVEKGALYAGAAVPEYWLLNLPGDCIEVFRDPRREPGAEARYSTHTTFHRGEAIVPVSFPRLEVRADALLPAPRR